MDAADRKQLDRIEDALLGARVMLILAIMLGIFNAALLIFLSGGI